MDTLETQSLRLLTRSPFWAILPERLASLFALMLHGPEAFQPTAAKPLAPGKGSNKIAVIPIEGVLTKDGPSWLGSNYNTITKTAEDAGADPAVKRVVLAVDSPGGEITGLPETAAVLSQVAKVKPVHAIVEGMAASAAYWLTSQASDIALTPSGEVGSVGVRMMHMDISKMLDDAGFKVTELYSGDFKTEWSPYKPLTDDAKDDMSKRLTAVHQDFIDSIANGRGKRTTENIRKVRFGEGRMFSATDALGHGLVDRVQSPREFYRAILSTQVHEVPSAVRKLRAKLEVERARFCRS